MAIETRTEVTGNSPIDPTPLPARLYPTRAASIGLLFARLPLGAYFIVAGATKLKNGRAGFVEYASTHIPDWSLAKRLPPDFIHGFLNSLPWIELAVGILLVLGLLTRVAGLAVSLLLISFIVCFTGPSGQLAETVKLPFQPNFVYLGSALAVLFCGPGRLSADGFLFGPRRKVVIREEYTERLA
jgi:putative oxidoreductase